MEFCGSHRAAYEKFVDGSTKDVSDELPFVLPKGWAWTRLNEIATYKKGPFGSALTKRLFVPKSEHAIKVYEQKNAIKKDASLGSYYISEDYFLNALQGFEVLSGDVIVSCAGTIGESYVMPSSIERGIINQALMRIRISPLLLTCYYIIIFDHIIKGEANAASNGSAMKNIPPFDVLKHMLVPLPPVAEQKRIVAKIEDLFAIADSLGSAADGLETAAKRLDKKILDLAIRGKLVPQDPNDEPASELVKRIAASHKSPSKNQSEPIDPPFDIPDSWEWVRLETICDFYLGKTPPRANQQYWIPPAVPWVTISDMIQHGRVTQTKEGVSSYAITKGVSGRISPKGTLLMSFKLTIGKVSILDCDATHNEAIISVLPYCDSSKTMRNYLFETLPCLVGNAETSPAIMGDTLNKKTLGNLLIPLPPLAEQKRIVAKIEELRTVIKSLTT